MMKFIILPLTHAYAFAAGITYTVEFQRWNRLSPPDANKYAMLAAITWPNYWYKHSE